MSRSVVEQLKPDDRPHLGGYRAVLSSQTGGEFWAERASVIADDLLVIENGEAKAGPRALSQRNDTAARLGRDTTVASLGRHERARLQLQPAAVRALQRGLVVLSDGDWSDDRRDRTPNIQLKPVTPLGRLAVIGEHIAHGIARPTPRALPDLAALPMWSLTRPRIWSALDPAAQAIASLLGAAIETDVC